jgi:hypothetical protein
VIYVLGTLLEHPLQHLVVEDASLDKGDVLRLGDIPLVGGREIVEDDDLLGLQLGKLPAKVAADATGPASDEDGLPFEIRVIVYGITPPGRTTSSIRRSA